MTDKLLCPFCNKPLQPTLRQSDEYWCENYDCPRTNIKWVGSQKLWQELIRTRKALNFAISTLTVISEGCVVEHSVVGHEDDNKIKLAKIALDKIKTALEQKD